MKQDGRRGLQSPLSQLSGRVRAERSEAQTLLDDVVASVPHVEQRSHFGRKVFGLSAGAPIRPGEAIPSFNKSAETFVYDAHLYLPNHEGSNWFGQLVADFLSLTIECHSCGPLQRREQGASGAA